jgi:signal peptidase I
VQVVSLPLPRARARRWLDGAASVALFGVVGVLAALALGLVAGYRVLVVRSDSMHPAIATGDLILTKRLGASSARVGEVITFADPSRARKLVTHRVVRRRRSGRRIAFVTRGDANTGVERWSIAANGTVGRYVGRLPRAGYAVAWFGTPPARLLFGTAASLLLGAFALRRIWL